MTDMREVPRLFIAVPVYNGENYLAESLESIRIQTFTDFVVVVFDNASTDSTIEIAEGFAQADPRFTLVRRSENIGAGPNFNQALSACQSPLFKWQAHDDVLAPTFLERCVEALDAAPDAVLAHSHVRMIDEDGLSMGEFSPIAEGACSKRRLTRFRTNLMSRDLCTEVFGVFRTDALRGSVLHLPFAGSDRVLLAEMSLRGRLVIIPEVLFYNREHDQRFRKTVLAKLEETNNGDSLLEWYDTSLASRKPTPQRWTFFNHLFLVAARNISNPIERWRSYIVVLGWLSSRLNRHDLLRDSLMLLHPSLFSLMRSLKRSLRGGVTDG